MPPRQTTPTRPKVTLNDLDDDARKALLAELEAEQRRSDTVAGIAPDAAERELTPREVAVRAILRERDHLDGCPVYGSTVGRVEAYAATRPANPAAARPAQTMTVARCIECGGTRTLEGDVATVLRATLEAAEEPTDLDGSI